MYYGDHSAPRSGLVLFAIKPSNIHLGVVLAGKPKCMLDGQRGIDHLGWEMR